MLLLIMHPAAIIALSFVQKATFCMTWNDLVALQITWLELVGKVLWIDQPDLQCYLPAPAST